MELGVKQLVTLAITVVVGLAILGLADGVTTKVETSLGDTIDAFTESYEGFLPNT